MSTLPTLHAETRPNNGKRWTLDGFVEHFLELLRAQPAGEPREPFALLPSIGSDHGREFLVRLLTYRDPWLDDLLAPCAAHHRALSSFTDPEERKDEEYFRKREMDALSRWGKTCVPPWSEYDLEQALREASQILRARWRARELGLLGIDAGEFASHEHSWDWHVEGVLLANQPAVVGGPQKALKTALCVDLAISLTSGTPFLGYFAVPRKRRVKLFSGESGEAVIHDLARRICKARGIDLQQTLSSWCFQLPRLGHAEDLEVLESHLRDCQVELVIIDPLYLCLTGGAGVNPADLYSMGPLLLNVGQACQRAGCTPILVQHTTKNTFASKAPLELSQLAFSGIGEWCRQWLLLSRRTAYRQDGRHQLLLNYGGSAGHSGLVSVDVNEGTRLPDGSGMSWDIAVSPYEPPSGCGKTDAREKLLTAYDELAKPPGAWVTFNKLKQRARFNSPKATRIIKELVAAGSMETKDGHAPGGNGAQQAAKLVRRK